VRHPTILHALWGWLEHPREAISVCWLWRLPSQAFSEVAVEECCPHLQYAVRAMERPLHLLLFDHPAGNEGIDGRFSE
jgi:hypothetical protein